MKKILMLSALLFFFGCKNRPKIETDNNFVTININSEEINKTRKLSQLIDTVIYVPLETNVQCLIGRIDKLIYKKDQFYILDKTSRTVFAFDTLGHMRYKYKNIGKGPFEYLEIDDFDVDSCGACYLLDTRKIIKLDKNLRPVDKFNLPFGTLRFALVEDKFAVQNYAQDDELFLISQSGKVVKSFFQYKGIQRKVPLQPFIQSCEGVLYNPIYSDTIYSISQSKISPHYSIKFEYPLSQDIFKLPKYKTSYGYVFPDKFMHGIYFYSETNRHLFFRFSYNYKGDDGPFFVKYNKQNKETIIYTNRIQNDCFFSQYPPMIQGVAKDSFFLATIPSSIFCQAMKESPNLCTIDHRLKTVTMLSNPIIALIKFK